MLPEVDRGVDEEDISPAGINRSVGIQVGAEGLLRNFIGVEIPGGGGLGIIERDAAGIDIANHRLIDHNRGRGQPGLGAAFRNP